MMKWPFAHSAVKAVLQTQHYTEEPNSNKKAPKNERTNWRAIMAVNESKY